MTGHSATITVILIGAEDNVREALASAVPADIIAPLRICSIRLECAANAWNQFVHMLRPRATIYFFVDGGVLVQPGAFAELAKALCRSPAASAAAAVPSQDQGAAMLDGGHRTKPRGLLDCMPYALRGEFVERLAARGLRLPIGLQHSGRLIGSFVLHDLDAVGSPCMPSRLVVLKGATWTMQQTSPLRWSRLRQAWNRRVAQVLCRLEDAAIGEIVSIAGFEGLPKFANQLLLDWIARHAPRGRSLFGFLVRRRLRRRQTADPKILDARCSDWRGGSCGAPPPSNPSGAVSV